MELTKEYKVFYKGFVKAQEHCLFSLTYSKQEELAKMALREKFDQHLIKYKLKVEKIDGLAERLQKIKAR